jgi:hypothetical protein
MMTFWGFPGMCYRKVHRNNQVQYMPRTMEIPEAKAVLSSNEMGDFLTATKPKYYSF